MRYTGQRSEESIGLYFYGARWYDPALGRFIQADTIVPNPGDPISWDRFAYVRNSPMIYNDPTGHNLNCGMQGSAATQEDCAEADPDGDGQINLPFVQPENNLSVTDPYSDKAEDWHAGIDYGVIPGEDISASAYGTVVIADACTFDVDCDYSGSYGGFDLAQVNAGYGNVVVIEYSYNSIPSEIRQSMDLKYGDSLYFLYAHLGKISVGLGDKVSPGQIIGTGGSTGNSTGTHLHMEVRSGRPGSIPMGVMCSSKSCYSPSTNKNYGWPPDPTARYGEWRALTSHDPAKLHSLYTK